MVEQKALKITIVQFSGDFREASTRLAAGGAETYRAQRYTVEFVERMAKHFESVTTITGFTQESYSVTLPSGAKAIGAGFDDRFDARRMIELVEATKPDRIILRTANIPLLRWVAKSRIPTLALLADSLPTKSWKDKLKRFLAVRYLNAPGIEVVANHGKAATDHLIKAGVLSSKAMAWDYPAINTPYDRDAKAAPSARRLLFAGSISEAKGVGDLLRAVAFLGSVGRPVTLDLYGDGNIEGMQKLASELNLAGHASFKGTVANDRVIDLMGDADLVVVPSRHEYSEGLPLTIYEALCSRTPLVVSDHPMFSEVVKDNQACLVFPASNAKALAEKIDRALSSTELYAKLSAESPEAWERVQISMKWGAVIDNWLGCAN